MESPAESRAADAMKTDALVQWRGPFLHGGTASIPYRLGSTGCLHGTGGRDISLPTPCVTAFSGNEARRRFGIGLRWIGGGIAAHWIFVRELGNGSLFRSLKVC